VLFELEKTKVTAVALDGFRLGKVEKEVVSIKKDTTYLRAASEETIHDITRLDKRTESLRKTY